MQSRDLGSRFMEALGCRTRAFGQGLGAPQVPEGAGEVQAELLKFRLRSLMQAAEAPVGGCLKDPCSSEEPASS